MFGYMGWAFAEFVKNIVFIDTVISPLMGGLITGVEFGLGGFGAGFGGAIGSGESIGEAFAAGGLGFASGFGLGFAAGYSYTAGWQNVMHGADTVAHNVQVEAQSRRVANMMTMLDEARAENGLLGQVETQRLIAKYNASPSAETLANMSGNFTNKSMTGRAPFADYARNLCSPRSSWNVGNASPYSSGIRTPFTTATMGGLVIKPLVVEGVSLTSAYVVTGGNAQPCIFIYGLIRSGIKALLGDEYSVPTKIPGIGIPVNPSPLY